MIKKSQNNKNPKVPDSKQSKSYFTDETGVRVLIHPKASIRIITKPTFSIEYLDEDGFPMETAEDVKDFNRRMRKKEKEKFLDSKVEYKLSRWGKEVVKILEENGEMKNVDIMDELRNRGCDTSANHLNKFFKSVDGKKFYKEQLIGNSGYWSLRYSNQSKTISIPIMITMEMRRQLKELGYVIDEIKHLTPIEAHKIIDMGVPKTPSRERGKNQ